MMTSYFFHYEQKVMSARTTIFEEKNALQSYIQFNIIVCSCLHGVSE